MQEIYTRYACFQKRCPKICQLKVVRWKLLVEKNKLSIVFSFSVSDFLSRSCILSTNILQLTTNNSHS